MDVHTRHAYKAIGHGRAGVARSGHQHMYGGPLVMQAAIIVQQMCHEPRSHILEGHRRAMEQLQHIVVVVDTMQRDVEIQRLPHDVAQHTGLYVALKGKVGNGVGNLMQRHVPHVAHKSLGQPDDTLRHIEAAILAHTVNHGSLKRHDLAGCLDVVVQHFIQCTMQNAKCTIKQNYKL